MSRRNWSRLEVEATVGDYMEMLSLELRGERFNKRRRNEALRERLEGRSPGAVERKHQNISAVLLDLGMPYVRGYKPLRNLQALLREVVLGHISPDLTRLVAEDVASPGQVARVDDPLTIEVDPPPRAPVPLVSEGRTEPRGGRPVDYLRREEANRSLGDAGETLAMAYEQARLRLAGRDGLARNVEQVSKTVGDHAGYDIRSYEVDGRDRFVEVKTTRYGKLTPFYISASEIRFSAARRDRYHLYRLFDFRRQPGLFVLRGDVSEYVRLSATEFRASF